MMFSTMVKTGFASSNELLNFSGSSLQATYSPLLVQASYSQINRFTTAVRQVEQASTNYLKAVENFRFSTTDYYAVELVAAVKFTQYSLRENGSFFPHDKSSTFNTHRVYNTSVYCGSQLVERSLTILPSLIQIPAANNCRASSQRQPSLNEHHSLREQRRLHEG